MTSPALPDGSDVGSFIPPEGVLVRQGFNAPGCWAIGSSMAEARDLLYRMEEIAYG